MIVETDDKSGFCFGVQNAVEIAEKALLSGERVFSLGPLVHNDKEVERLSSMGLVSIDHEYFKSLRDCKVLVRAHGEPPSTYITASRNNITIIEATCPIVRRLQSKIRDTWEKKKDGKGQIVIFGKRGHAEVIGLLGQINNEGIVASGAGDISKIDVTRPVWLFAQTTMGKNEYMEFASMIRSAMEKSGNDPASLLKVHNTICSQVSGRVPDLKAFAGRHDVIIFVSGRESSNGKMLFSVCKSVNPETYFISSPGEIEPGWFTGKNSTGICGATSTPGWLIEKVRDQVVTITNPGNHHPLG
jgi:4-hydroxy-3-methylbut-2-enyl diphosphate reductase